MVDSAINASAALAKAQPRLTDEQRADVLALRGLLVRNEGACGRVDCDCGAMRRGMRADWHQDNADSYGGLLPLIRPAVCCSFA